MGHSGVGSADGQSVDRTHVAGTRAFGILAGLTRAVSDSERNSKEFNLSAEMVADSTGSGFYDGPYRPLRSSGCGDCFAGNLCEFDITAERIGKLHLTRTAAFWLQQEWVSFWLR
jgi:hypothetical protein